MENCLIPFGIVLGLIVFVLCPILTLYVFVSYRRRIEALESKVLDLGRRLAASGATAIRKADAEIPKPISPPAAAAVPTVPPPPPAPLSAPSHPLTPAPAPAPRPSPERSAPPSPPVPASRPLPSAPRIAAIPKINWENFLGVKLFAWIGGLVAFLAAAFFIKYSFDNNLISPPFRVAIGLAVGLGTLLGGLRMPRERYSVLAQSLCATGILI